MLSFLWGGKKAADAKPENDNPELAMREQLDQHGDFVTKLDGTLEYQDFCLLRAVILRQAIRSFAEQKTKLNASRLEAFKAKNQQEYVKLFRELNIGLRMAIQSMTKKACEWISLEPQNYEISFKTFMEQEDKRREIGNKDKEIHRALEAKEIKESQEDIIKASKFKFKRDMDMFRKLQSLKFTTSGQAQAEI